MPMLRLLVAALLLAAQKPETAPDAISISSQNPLIVEGDDHYRKRQDGRAGAMANPREILLSVSAYDRASAAPDSAESRWKLARSLYFQGAYTNVDDDARKAIFEKARRVSEDCLHIIERRAKARKSPPFEELSPADIASAVRSDPDALPCFFWAAVSWGQWALLYGKIESAKTGAADKIRDYATVVIELDPQFEEGGGYRILGRLHHQAPWVPFFTTWVSRDKAVEYLRKAVAINSNNFVNRHFLAEALADGSAAERTEAIQIEEKLVADAPSPNHLVEELSIQIDAKKDLAKWKSG